MKCTQCNDRNGNTRCEGCNTLFCLPCLTKHHDELAQQFVLLMDTRNEIQQLLNNIKSTESEEKQRTCLNQIDKWERNIIQQIQAIATKARTSVIDIITKRTFEISHRFEKLSIEMQKQQKEGNYLENDIQNVKTQLNQVKNDIEQMNENISVDFTQSHNIQWEALINIVENESSNNKTSKSIKTNDTKIISNFSKLSKSSRVQDNSKRQYDINSDQQQDKVNSSPVQMSSAPPSSNQPDLQIFEKRQVTNVCRLCTRTFHDLEDTDICPECEYEISYAAATNDVARRPTTAETRGANMYPEGKTSAFPTVATPRTIEHRNIRCPFCHAINLNYGRSGSSFMCSRCKKIIPSAYLRS